MRWMQLPEFSLIIPVYQVKDYLVECLESVFCQIPADVQVILVDDGSTDGSGEICDQYSQKYPQIEVIHQRNQGVAAARNAGLAVAKGEYLLWVDPDDWVSENWYRTIKDAVVRMHSDILVFDYDEVENENVRSQKYGRDKGFVDKEEFLNDVIRDIRMNSSLWNKVIRRALFDGITFDEKLRCLEDYAILHKVIMKSDSVAYIPLLLYHYRIRFSGLVRTINLDVSYQSYEVALRRKAEIEATGRKCDSMGCVLQARGFCRNYYLLKSPKAFWGQFQKCKMQIQKNFFEILLEKELGIMDRLKLFFISFSKLGSLYFKEKSK